MQNFEYSDQHYCTSGPAIANTGDGGKNRCGDGTWDIILRSVCRGGMFWEDAIPPKSRPVPIHIRTKLPKPNDDLTLQTLDRNSRSHSRLFHLQAVLNSNRLEDGSSLSPWVLLQVFILDAVAEVIFTCYQISSLTPPSALHRFNHYCSRQCTVLIVLKIKLVMCYVIYLTGGGLLRMVLV
jgi:hypothetical protein